MPISIVVEDGTGTNPAANSYVSIADAVLYNSNRGVIVPDPSSDAAAQQLLRAMDYLEAQAARWIGFQLLSSQPLSWPREYVAPNSPLWAERLSGVDIRVINAQCTLFALAGTVNFFPAVTDQALTKEVIGPLEFDYSERLGTSSTPLLYGVDAILQPLYNSNGQLLTAFRA